VFIGQAREKTGSESWLVFVLNMMFSLFIGPLLPKSGKESLVEL